LVSVLFTNPTNNLLGLQKIEKAGPSRAKTRCIQLTRYWAPVLDKDLLLFVSEPKLHPFCGNSNSHRGPNTEPPPPMY